MIFLDSERYFWSRKTNLYLPGPSGEARLSDHKNASPLMLMRTVRDKNSDARSARAVSSCALVMTWWASSIVYDPCDLD